jgi:hypothetical protein
MRPCGENGGDLLGRVGTPGPTVVVGTPAVPMDADLEVRAGYSKVGPAVPARPTWWVGPAAWHAEAVRRRRVLARPTQFLQRPLLASQQFLRADCLLPKHVDVIVLAHAMRVDTHVEQRHPSPDVATPRTSSACHATVAGIGCSPITDHLHCPARGEPAVRPACRQLHRGRHPAPRRAMRVVVARMRADARPHALAGHCTADDAVATRCRQPEAICRSRTSRQVATGLLRAPIASQRAFRREAGVSEDEPGPRWLSGSTRPMAVLLSLVIAPPRWAEDVSCWAALGQRALPRPATCLELTLPCSS